MQRICIRCKNENFSRTRLISLIFLLKTLIVGTNKNCLASDEYTQSLLGKENPIKKNNVYPLKPPVEVIKMGSQKGMIFMGVFMMKT